MSAVYTSRVPACMNRLYTLYTTETDWPQHPILDRKPSVYFAGIDGAVLPLESVIIVGVPQDPARFEWATLGAARQDEIFVLRVQIDSLVSTLEQDDVGMDVIAFNRIRQLANVAQIPLRDQEQGGPAGGFGRGEQPGDDDCRGLWWGVVGFTLQPVLTDAGTGWSCDIDIAFQTRI